MPTRRPPAEGVKAIYDAYPRKVKPTESYKAIQAAICRIARAREWPELVAECWLLHRTKLYASIVEQWEVVEVNGRDIRPHPATWFNGNRFEEDEYEWRKAGRRRDAERGFESGGDDLQPRTITG